MSNANEAAEAVDNAPSSCAAGGNNFVPAAPMGQNAGEAAANGAVTDTYGLPPAVLNNKLLTHQNFYQKVETMNLAN